MLDCLIPFDEDVPPAPGEWADCPVCDGDCYSRHDCGADVCRCLVPQDNVICDWCDGMGGWIHEPD